MVYFFTLTTDPTLTCYMGRDKYENEELIRWGWPEDVWFHVDDFSSAHVYLRYPIGTTVNIDAIPPAVVAEAAQLTKQNSIEGCKQARVRIVYTPWSNLHKTATMEVGAIGFVSPALRRFTVVEGKDTAMLKRLERSKDERVFDGETARGKRDAEVRATEKRNAVLKLQEEKAQREAQKTEMNLKHFTALRNEQDMRDNQQDPPNEEDFM